MTTSSPTACLRDFFQFFEDRRGTTLATLLFIAVLP